MEPNVCSKLPHGENTNTIRVGVENEHGTLVSVIIGTYVGYHHDMEQFLKDVAEYPLVPRTEYYEEVLAGTFPTAKSLQVEYEAFENALTSRGVHVFHVDFVPTVFDQTCPRDIGFVLGNSFVKCNMGVASRADEIKGIQKLLDRMDCKFVELPANVLVEGGDVIVDSETVFVGYNTRSSKSAASELQKLFPNRRIIGIPHKVLHLDCCFQPLGKGHALYLPQAFDILPKEFSRYILIAITPEEGVHLATNILSLSADTIIMRQGDIFGRLTSILENLGYIIVPVKYDGVPATGGSFRCSTLTIERSA